MAEEARGGDLSRLRQLNARAVVRVLRGEPPLTLSEIARRTGLSRASTDDVVRQLTAQGWVAEAERTAGTIGRPARRYRFCADAGRVLGVEVGERQVTATVADLDGAVTHTARIAVDASADRTGRLAAVDEAARQARSAATAELGPGGIWATGVATPGLVDADGRVAVCDDLPDWTGVDLRARLARSVPGTVLVDTLGNLAALAESWRGAAHHAEHAICLYAGPTTGAGLIIGGAVHRGFGNAAGQIGALPAAGWERARRRVRDWRPTTAGSGPADDADAGAVDVFTAARAGDRSAVNTVRAYARDLGAGTAALVLTLDPQLLVLSGGFADQPEAVTAPLRRELTRRCLRAPEILVSPLGERAVVLGAVRLALDHVRGLGVGGPLSSSPPSPPG
ncbi:ROK family protein [Streptomyces sp. NPDC048636]|uniref:ROK family transcriptional regulator n=1 Tax=Streptomyces sp. NPDC048636 TaxID=3155762 RepID=UPI003445A703